MDIQRFDSISRDNSTVLEDSTYFFDSGFPLWLSGQLDRFKRQR